MVDDLGAGSALSRQMYCGRIEAVLSALSRRCVATEPVARKPSMATLGEAVPHHLAHVVCVREVVGRYLRWAAVPEEEEEEEEDVVFCWAECCAGRGCAVRAGERGMAGQVSRMRTRFSDIKDANLVT